MVHMGSQVVEKGPLYGWTVCRIILKSDRCITILTDVLDTYKWFTSTVERKGNKGGGKCFHHSNFNKWQ